MKCPKCQMPNQDWASFCSGCGEKLSPKAKIASSKTAETSGNQEITVNLVEKKQMKPIGCFGIAIIVLVVVALFSSLSNSNSSEQASSPTPAITQDTGAYCAILMKSLNEAVVYMGNAGTKYTLEDVAGVLEKRGTALASGFDLEMAGSPDRLAAIREAGNQLLQIRVNLIDGGDITPAAEAFKVAFDYISATCE